MPGPTRANRRANSPKPDAFEQRLAAIAKTAGGIKAQVERMKSVREVEDDPRLTTAILGWLHEARWSGSGTAEGWQAMFERLLALRDERAIAPLRQMASDLPPFVGVKHRAFMAAEIAKVADALEKAAPKKRVAHPIVLKKPGATADTMAIVQRVFDAPHDDDLRRVVADALLEHGDPWGELIQLGFLIDSGAATPEQKRAADALLKKNAATFAGPISKISKTDSRTLTKGFLSRVLANASMVPRSAWDAAATTAYWATVTRLEIDMVSTPKWWIPALMKNPAVGQLREVHFNRYYDPQISLERTQPAAPWRVVDAKTAPEPWLRFFRDFIRALPEAERKRVEVGAIQNRDVIQEALDEAR